MNEIRHATQAVTRLPNYAQSIDWSFCQSKASYLTFVAEWKYHYRQLSSLIRVRRLTQRGAASEQSRPGNKKASHLKRLAAFTQKANGDWVWTLAQKPGPTFLAQWMLELRAAAKVKSNEAWKASTEPPV